MATWCMHFVKSPRTMYQQRQSIHGKTYMPRFPICKASDHNSQQLKSKLKRHRFAYNRYNLPYLQPVPFNHFMPFNNLPHNQPLAPPRTISPTIPLFLSWPSILPKESQPYVCNKYANHSLKITRSSTRSSSLFDNPIMDPASASSSSTPNDLHHHNRLHHRFKPPQPLANRIARALRHPLFLLHRSDSNFFILGATGNVYTVTLCSTPSCTCPDRTTPCKHILFVLIRVLGVSIDDTCLRRRTLRPCRLSRLLSTPALPEALAGARLRERFHQLFSQAKKQGGSEGVREIEEGTRCPVCLEEMEKGEKVVACSTCRNLIHEECLMRWKRSRGRRSACCVICRARWSADQEKYLNLAPYINQDEAAEGGGGGNGGSLNCVQYPEFGSI